VPLVVKLAADADTADLAAWLEADDELRGHVRREPAAVPDGALGTTIAQLALSLGSGSAVTAMASVVIAWLRRRTGSVAVRLTRPDGSTVELQAERVRALDAAGLRAQVEQVVAVVWPAVEEEEPSVLALPDPEHGELPDDGA
jgi:hypothetical protein